MSIKKIQYTLFSLSIFVVEFAVIGYCCSNEIENKINPIGNNLAKSEHKQLTIPHVVEKKKNMLPDKTGTPYNKMSDSQIVQIKRRDCRLKKETIPHDYKK